LEPPPNLDGGVEYRILGPVEARHDGQPVDLGTPKQRALLGILVVHAGQVVAGDRLADLLWDGAPPGRAEVSLRSYVANLRRALPDGAIASERGGYRLAVGDGDEVDALAFTAAVAEARRAAAAGDHRAAAAALEAGLVRWHGTALADLGGLAFGRTEAARLEEQRRAAVELRYELLLDAPATDVAALVPALEQAVADDPLREGLCGLLMRALDRVGRRTEALAAFAALRERLADEVGLDPSPALRSLEAAIRDGTVRSPASSTLDPPADVAPAPAPARAPLLGRERELGRLRQALDRARAGQGGMVVVSGDPGIGKTRLVQELVAEAAAAGALTASVATVATGDAPAFWPWAQLLRQLDAEVDLAPLLDARTADVGALLPELARPTPPAMAAASTDAARFQRFDAVTALLTRLGAATGRPVVVTVDDVQWADAASLHLLGFLAGAAALPTSPLLVVATHRLGDDDRSPDDLKTVLTTLRRGHAVECVDLDGLDDAAVAELVSRTTEAAAPAALVAAIVERAGGNPFFVTELLRADPAGLRVDTVPAAVRDVVRQRVARLDRETARVLGVATVLGREVDGDVLVELEGDAALDALDEAVTAHLLEEDAATGRFRFPHALVAEVLAEGVAGLRRARVHARLAKLLDGPRVVGDEGRLAELARHCCAGVPADPGLATRAAEVTLEAAAAASHALGYEAAAALAERALAATEGALVDPVLRARLLIAVADARRAGGDPAASRDACLAAAELAREADDAELLASAATGLALPGAVIGMDFGLVDDLRIELLETALERLPPGDTPLRVRVLAHLALALYLSPRTDRRDEVVAEAVATAERVGSPGVRAAAEAARRSTLWSPARLDERTAASRRIVELAEEGGAAQTALEGHVALAIDLLEAGRVDEFEEEVRTVERRADELRQPFYRWYSGALDATRASLEGRYEEATAIAAAAREVGGLALGRRALWGHVGWQFVTTWDTGGLAEVEAPLRALASAFPDNVTVRTALALVLVETDRADEAAAVVAAELADPSTIVVDATWTFCLTLLVEVAHAVGDVPAATALADLLTAATGRLVLAGSGVACLGAADRARGLALLTIGRERFDEAEAALSEALALEQRAGAVPWAARTQGMLALLHLRRGGAGDAAAASARLDDARATAARLGAHGLRARLDRIGG
jgi:DNA-binding SARP family transcriptional activator